MKVGLLGGGQLGRMMAEAGAPLGLSFRAADSSPNSCAGQVCELVTGAFDDNAFIERFCQGLDAVTYEWENVPLEAARRAAALVPNFFPPLKALEVAQDRLWQKEFLNRLNIATAPFRPVNDKVELKQAVLELGFPAVLKTRRHGYDGKGQFILKSEADIDLAWTQLGSVPLVLEKFIPFTREVSIVGARSREGKTSFYPLAQNEHKDGILRVSAVPALGETVSALQTCAEQAALTVMSALSYVGVLTIEFFEHEGTLLVNEVATRVHNSGHWTMTGAQTSQFENHLRAGLGMPLGSTELIEPTVMVNIIGDLPDIDRVKAVPAATMFLYGKEPRPGRKLGHVNAPADKRRELLAAMKM